MQYFLNYFNKLFLIWDFGCGISDLYCLNLDSKD